MSVRHSIANYHRDQGLELEDALTQSLLDSSSRLDSRSLLGSSDSVNKLNFEPTSRKTFHGTITIRLKSDVTEATTRTAGSDEEYLTNQYNVYTEENGILEEPRLIPFDDHPYLSPTKPSAEALVFSIHLFDFSFGVFLVVRAFMSMLDQYGNLTVSLFLGILLMSGSIAGMCWRILLGNGVKNRSLSIFNIALGFIGFGIYYVLSLLLLTSMATMSSFVGTELTVGAQFTLCLLGFILSVGEVYKIMFIQYHHYSSDDDSTLEQQRNSQNSGSSGRLENANDVENESVAPAVTFV